MLEKRKHKRLKMEHALELARLNADGTADDGVVNADILNISRGGIGFLSRKSLEVGSYYDTRISLFSREMIDAVLEIVHVTKGLLLRRRILSAYRIRMRQRLIFTRSFDI